MANDQTFSFKLVKISLIVLNSLIIIGLSFLLLIIGSVFGSPFVIVMLAIGSNFVVSIIGVIRESRPTVMMTGSITLTILLLGVFSRSEQKGNSTFSLLYLLAIVVLSYAYSAMLKERQLQNNNRRPQSEQQLDSNSSPFTAVVIYHPPNTTPQQVLPFVPSTGPEVSDFKDPPPAYFNDNDNFPPPPKYEEVVDNQK